MSGGNISDRTQGADYNQSNLPSDTALGKLWWDREKKQMFGANGEVWGSYAQGIVPDPYAELGRAGYVAQGTFGHTGYLSSIERLTFVTETVAAIASNAVVSLGNMQGMSSFVKGFTQTTSLGAQHTRLIFATETTYAGSMNMPSNHTHRINACGNYGNSFGIIAGGYIVDVAVTARITKLTFNTELLNSITSSLTRGGYNMAMTSSPTNGYFSCRNVVPSGSGSDAPDYRLDKIVFFTETTSLVNASAFNKNTCQTGASVPTRNCGYYYTGVGGAGMNYVHKLLFTPETLSVLAQTIASRAQNHPLASKMDGYMCGGGVAFGASYADIRKIFFISDTIALIASTLIQARRAGAGFMDFAFV